MDSDQTYDRQELNYGDDGLLGKGLKRFFNLDDDPNILLQAIEESEIEYMLVEANFARSLVPGVSVTAITNQYVNADG